MGASGEFGVVAVGARAHLILVTGDPLEDIEAVAEPAGVMVRGVWLTREELVSRLNSLAESCTQQLRGDASETGAYN